MPNLITPDNAMDSSLPDRATAGPPRAFGVWWFWIAIRQYRVELGLVLLASLFVQVLALVTPLAFQVVIDKVLAHRTEATLVVMLAALAGAALFEVILCGLRQYLLSHTTQRVDVELGARLFRHLIRLPLSFFQSRHQGDVLASMRELETARGFLTGQALTAWLDLFFALVFLAVMLYYSPLLTLIVIAFLPLFFGASALASPVLRGKFESRFALAAGNQSFLAETIASIETLKSQAVEDDWQHRWENRLARLAVAAFEAGHTGNLTVQLTSLFGKALTVTLLGAGAMQVIDGHLSVGGLIAFNMLAGRVNAPIVKLSTLWQEIQQMRVAIARLAAVMDAREEPGTDGAIQHDDRGASHFPVREPIRGHITLERVSFAYTPDAPHVLVDLSFVIPPGQVVGIVGISGSGKTTLIRLLQRLYTAGSGRVLIDGVDVAGADVTWLRRQIGVVAQDTALMNLSVRDNIALSHPGLPPADLLAAAKLAGAHAFIQALPHGYETPIGERGSLLSGGQRARIAIARALAGNPRLLLLDEATASLDHESERAIHANLRRICQGRTVIIVAHRLSTLRLADRILVLDKGRLVEQGDPQALLALPHGRYRAMSEASLTSEAALEAASEAASERASAEGRRVLATSREARHA